MRFGPRIGAALVCILTLVGTASSAQAGCPEQEAWAEKCHTASFHFQVDACPAGAVIGSVRLKSGALPIELKPATGDSFRRVGDIGVQPIGEFLDWNQEPRERREALEAMLSCVRQQGAPPIPVPDEAEQKTPSPRLLLIGLLLLLAALGQRLRLSNKSTRQSMLRAGAALGALTLGVAWLRWHFVAPVTFHQNGQGPLWVFMALDPEQHNVYGPGYAEVFGWLVTRMDPERAVYLVNSALYALMLPALFAISRISGLPRKLSWLLTLSLAVQPLAARLAGSESYFAAMSALGMLACLAMLVAIQPAHELTAPGRRWLFLLGGLAAAALIAQAARIHPLGWSALGLIPLAPLCLKGSLSRRVIRTAILVVIVVGILLATSLPAMRAVLEGELGSQWLPKTKFHFNLIWRWALYLPALLWVVARLRRDALIPSLGIALVIAIAIGSDQMEGQSKLVVSARYWLFLPALLGAGLGWASRLGSLTGTLASAGAIGAALGWGWEYRKSFLTLPTDTLEIAAANRWKHDLPQGSHVLYVSRLKQRVLYLPLYDQKHADGMRLAPDQRTIGRYPNLYYYRSSLCTVPQGKTFCEEVESRLDLTPVLDQVLPSRTSIPHLPRGPEPVHVVLFRAEPKPIAP